MTSFGGCPSSELDAGAIGPTATAAPVLPAVRNIVTMLASVGTERSGTDSLMRDVGGSGAERLRVVSIVTTWR
jgi:hypothetical protein